MLHYIFQRMPPFVQEEDTLTGTLRVFFLIKAMVEFAGGSATFEASLYDTFSKLCRDSNASVRRIMAAGCHEVTEVKRSIVCATCVTSSLSAFALHSSMLQY